MSGEAAVEQPAWHKAVGISLAVSSAVFIGTSFIVKKKGLIDSGKQERQRRASQQQQEMMDTGNAISVNDMGFVGVNCEELKAGLGLVDDSATSVVRVKEITSSVKDSHAYLYNKLWWTGMILMLVGEILNLMAYSFSPAILVTPLGALSVVISAYFSSVFLNERLSFSGKVGCAQCVLGAIIVVLHAPVSSDTNTIPEFISFVIQPWFLAYAILVLLVVLALIFIASPRYGHKTPLVYISICSITGSFVVVTTQGFGSAVVYSISNPSDNQFVYWQTYIMMAFILCSGVVQINYLNKALNMFSTAVVTPVYYVMFTTATLLCSGILLHVFTFSSAVSFVTLLIGFLVIVGGVALLFQYSLKLTKLASTTMHLDVEERVIMLDGDDEVRGGRGGGGGDADAISSATPCIIVSSEKR